MLPAGARYDRVIDAVGRRKTSPLKVAAQAAFAAGGRYLSVDDSLPRFRAQDLVFLTQLAERIADAHRYVEQGHKKRNVIIEMA